MSFGDWFADKFPALGKHATVLRASWQQQNEREAKARPQSDHEFLPAALEIMEKPPSPGFRYLLLALCALFTITLAWSFIGKVDVVATASGKVIPSGNIKIIQPIEIGYVRAIHVKNGQHVEAWYHELVESSSDTSIATKQGSAADAIAGFVSEISRTAGLAGKLSECDVSRDDLPKLAVAATQQWTGKFNPVELSGEDYLKLYDAAF